MMTIMIYATLLPSGVVLEEQITRKGGQYSRGFVTTVGPDLKGLVDAMVRKELRTTEGRVVQIQATYTENETYTTKTLVDIVLHIKVMV
jgi:hypothetical protein